MLGCLEAVLTMQYNELQNEFVNPLGVEVRSAPFGTFESLLPESSANFKPLRDALSSHGYKEGTDLFAAPYEWRRAIISIPEFTTSLSALVETAYMSNGNHKTHFIAHSSGGSMLLYFMNKQSQEWKDKYVESIITLSGNFAGEVDNYHDIITGLPVIEHVSKSVYQTWDFYAWLLPNPRVYGGNRTIIYTSSRNYTAHDSLKLLLDLGLKPLANLYPQYSELTGRLDPPNVTTHCFFGSQLPTAAGYIYSTLDKPPTKTIESSGDGEQDDTTNMSCKKWASMSPRYFFEAKEFPGVKHTEMPTHPDVVKEILSIVIA
jgi:lysophospholipase-3